MNAEDKIALVLADLKNSLKDLSKNIASAAPPKDEPPVPPSMDFTKTDIALNMQDPKTVRGLTDFVQKILIPQLRAGDRSDPRATLQATQKTTVLATKQLDYLKKQFNVEIQSGKDLEALVGKIAKQNRLAADQYSLSQESTSMLGNLNTATNRLAEQDGDSSELDLNPLATAMSAQAEQAQSQYDVSMNMSSLLASMKDNNTTQAEQSQAQYEATMNSNSLLSSMKNSAEMQLYTAQDAEERLKSEKQVVQQAQGVVIQDIDKDAAGVLGGIFGKLKGLFGKGKQSKPPPTKGEEESWLWGLLTAGAAGLMNLLGGGVTSMVGKVISKTFGLGTTIMKKSWGFAKNLATKTGGLIKSGLGKAFNVGKNLFSKSVGFAKNLGGKALGALKGGFGKAFDVGKGLFSKSFGFLKNLGTKSLGVLKSGFSKFTGSAGNIAMKAGNAIKGGLGKAFNVGKGLLGKLGGLGKGLAKIGASAGSSVLGAVSGSMPSGGGLLKSVGKLARFAGPVGAIVAGGMAVFDGVGSAMDEYKKSGSITAAAREGVASAASTLTFGLVDQETFSGAFQAVGDAMGPVGDWIGGQMESAWDGVTALADGNIAEGVGHIGEYMTLGLVDAETIQGFAEDAGAMISDAAGAVGDHFATGWNAITSIAEGNFSEGLGSAAEYLTFGLVDSDTVKNFAGNVGDTLSKAGSWLSEGASSVWDSVSGFFSNSPDVWDVLDDSGKTLGEGTAKVSESTAKVAKDAELHAKTTEEQSKGLGGMVGDLFTKFTPLGMVGSLAAKGVGSLVDGVKGLFSDSDSEMTGADKDMRDQIHQFMNKIFDWFDEAIAELENRERTTLEEKSESVGSFAKDLFMNLTPIGLAAKALSKRDEEASVAHDKKIDTSNKLLEIDQQSLDMASNTGTENNDAMITGIKSAEDKISAVEASNRDLVTKMSSLIEIQQKQLAILETGNKQRGVLQGEMVNAVKNSQGPTVINNSSSSNNTTVQQSDSNVMTNFRDRVYGGVA